MSDDNTPEPSPENAYPPPSSAYPGLPPEQAASNPYDTPGPPQSNPFGSASPPVNDPYQDPVQQPWPPPPVGTYGQTVGLQYSPVNGTMILILGILGLTICGFCGPIAWVMGNQAMKTLDMSGDPLNQRGMVNGGRICGIIGTALVGLLVVFYIIMFALGMLGAITHPSGR